MKLQRVKQLSQGGTAGKRTKLEFKLGALLLKLHASEGGERLIINCSFQSTENLT